MRTLLQDLRFAVRSLVKRPGFTAVAVLSLALGIGANTAIFSVIDAALLRPLPYADPGRLVDLYESSQQMEHGSVSPPALRDWREQNHVFSQQESQRGSHWLAVIGRIKLGFQLSAVNAEMRQIATRLAKRYPNEQKGRGVLVVPLRQDLTNSVRPALFVLLGAAGLVLLIACANVANLLLARASDRRREFAIRLALGAGRARLIRQVLTESVLLALLGGVAGLLLAYVGAGALLRIAGPSIPFGNDVGFDPRVFAFLLVIAVGTGVVFGLVPAFRSTQVDLQSDLKEGGGKGSAGRGRQRFRSLLVIGETALALVLLVGAGLLMRAFVKLQNTDTGMVTRNVLTMHLSVPSQKYDSAVSTRFYQPVLQHVRAVPGVRAAGLITLLPLQDSHSYSPVAIEGRTPDKQGDEPIAENRVVSPGYFGSLGIRVLQGHNFSERNVAHVTPELIINHAFASKYFPNSDPVGRRIRLSDSVSAPIVGVVADVRESQLDQLSAPTMYFSFLQYQPNDMVLVISTTVPPQSVTAAARGAIHAVDPSQPVFNVKTMDRVVAESVASSRFYFWLLGTFAVIALALAAAGIYGVMSYVVTQRRREIGIRMALGAEASAVRRMVVRQGMVLTIAGLALGTVAAFVLTRVLAKLLYGVSATDPVTFAAVALLLAAVALVASYIPARRAAQVDPIVSLRYE